MAPKLALSKIQLICDMLRSDEQLTVSEIACTVMRNPKAVYHIRSNLELFGNAKAPPIRPVVANDAGSIYYFSLFFLLLDW